MKLEEYKSGEYVKMNDYKAFTPSKINYNWGWDDTNYGVEKIKEGFPVCTRLIREIHEILMQGVRGEYKTPGEFRISQNWIGGSMPSTAVYIPPPHTEVTECLSDFEKFINNEEIDTPDLIKSAILHYQFESIHPFLDGNGRIGRLLIPLYIQSKGMLEKSCLYISDYIERNKDTYYDMLTRVRTNNDMIGWIKFFLEAVIETSKTAKEKFRNVVELTMEMDKVIMGFVSKTRKCKKGIRCII